MILQVPNPIENGYSNPEEQLAFYRGLAEGQTAAGILIGNMLAEEHHYATHDSLTGLLNHAGFEEKLKSIKDPSNYAFLYADATNFKAINDTLGHTEGDAVLKEIADVLRESLREGDIVARIGGDEFVALIDLSFKGNSRRHNELPEVEKADHTRDRIGGLMIGVLERHADTAVLGFQLAVGVAYIETSEDTIASLKKKSESEMNKHKSQQHVQYGRYKRPES